MNALNEFIYYKSTTYFLRTSRGVKLEYDGVADAKI